MEGKDMIIKKITGEFTPVDKAGEASHSLESETWRFEFSHRVLNPVCLFVSTTSKAEMGRFPLDRCSGLVIGAPISLVIFRCKVDLIYIMFNSRVSSQKLGATDTALCSPSFNKVKQNWRNKK